MLAARRTFTRAETRRAWERQGRICTLCGRHIPFDLMHGDHIQPHSQGGSTGLDNCQALCGSCNLRKGSRPQAVIEQFFRTDAIAPRSAGVLRKWQLAALDVVMPLLLNEPILVEACPGAGKTTFGLEVAYRLIASGSISRVIIVVPSLGIADGWAESASARDPFSATLPLRGPRNWRPTEPIGDRWVGVVSTYQSLFAATDMFLAHATDPGHRTLLVFDEVHHAGVRGGWGRSAQEAFAGSAKAILSLTGTPFRTARDPIVFVLSVGGSAKPHFRYDYGQAIGDAACRPVQFVHARGTTTFRLPDGATHTVSFDDQHLNARGSRSRLRTALEYVAAGSIAHTMLRDANDYLLHLRRSGDADAGGLVVCVDCDHADRVAAFLRAEILKQRPTVACSRLNDPGDPAPAQAIGSFRKSRAPWLVAVNMVSEGVDIRRLRCVVYLTNRLTLLSFRQIVGRVVRSDASNGDDHGRVYIPADPTLLEMATTITEEVSLLPPPIVIVTDSSPTRRINISAGKSLSEFVALRSEGTDGSSSDTSGHWAPQKLVAAARRYIARRGLSEKTDPYSLALAALDNPKLRAALEDDVHEE
ncbi:MAG TPA: DEAD/DEAH box helicase family protein [Candidatus Binatia bacterium]|nr:DEAD/DEAH box helicase family protein [Candidatus Binatia bacterium]